jgi:CRISPR-associated endoribonuclease Cas6
MRLRCQLETNKLPVSYRMMFVSLIKESLKRSDPDFFESLYFYNGKPGKKSKHFCSSLYLPEFVLENDEFYVNGNVSFFISSPDYEFLLHLYNGLQRISEFTYKSYSLQRRKITLLEEPIVTTTPAYFKTLSPIYIRDCHHQSVHPDDPQFEKELNYIANVTLQNYRTSGIKKPIRLLSHNLKKVVIKEKVSGFDQKGYLYLTAYRGTFCVDGDIEDLNLLSQLGFGFRRNQLFGMVEVI